MNSRILKKLSKKAADLLPTMPDHLDWRWANSGEIFDGGECGDSHQVKSCDRKHQEDWSRRGKNNRHPKGGNTHGYMHVIEGTLFRGWTTGYYEPEFECEPLWETLANLYCEAHTDYDPMALDEDALPVYTGARPAMPFHILSWARSVASQSA